MADGLIAGKPAPTLEYIHRSKCGSWLACDEGLKGNKKPAPVTRTRVSVIASSDQRSSKIRNMRRN
ncbi:hypothetical protein KIN13_12665, partial [Vibrio cholerae]